jgi:SdrD B-like domain
MFIQQRLSLRLANYCPLLFAFCFWLGPSVSDAQISGTVFRDYNANGQKNNSAAFNEPFVAGVKVYAYNSSGGVDSTITNASGAYSFTGLTLPVRIEFRDTLAEDYSGPIGTGSNSSVQFYTTASSTANYGVNYPQHYCQTTPNLVTPCYVNGRPSGTGNPVIVKYPYAASGTTSVNNYLAEAEDIGATWGIAFNRQQQRVYTSAFVKRHVGIKDNDADGKEDIGAIYSLTPTGSPTLWLKLDNLGVDVGLGLMPTIATRDLPTDPTQPSHDSIAFDLVGKIGLGDIDISDDNQFLYVVNLFDKKVYTIDMATKTLVGAGVAVPNACNNGNLRPFGLSYHRGKIYVGAICDATVSNDTADLKANVYRLDGASFTNVLSFPLSYTKGEVEGGMGVQWNPWRSNFYPYVGLSSGYEPIFPQPILCDIDFDAKEEMILTFTDRYGHQMGYQVYGTLATDNTLYNAEVGGDILRAALVNGNYVLERNATVGGVTTAGAGNNQGPGGGEFYFEEKFLPYHQETVVGGSALLMGYNEVAVNVFDPLDIFSGGTYWMNNTTGAVNRGYQIFKTGTAQTFGKANGLGDIELLCNAQPIEIGNFVWNDANKNGRQDPNESGIDGVKVYLIKNGVKIDSTTTTGGGRYGFSNAATGVATGFKYNVTNLLPNSSYEIRIENTAAQPPLSILTLTSPNNGGGDVRTSLRDSDGSFSGNNAVKIFATGGGGTNNHAYDFGFMLCDTTLTVSNTTICNGTAVNLFAQASGVKGTVTYSTNGTTWTALTNPTNLTPSVSTTFFIKDSLATYCLDIDTLQIIVNQPVTAGVGTNPAAICQAGSGIANINLAAQITGATSGGTWSQTNGTTVGTALNTTTGVFNPNGIGVGTYVFRYTVVGTSPCPNDTRDITITIQACCPPSVCLPVTTTRN